MRTFNDIINYKKLSVLSWLDSNQRQWVGLTLLYHCLSYTTI